MSWWHSIVKWGAGVRQHAREEDLNRELRAHLDLEAEEQRESGLTELDAAYAARRALGNVPLIKEDTRATWSWMLLERLVSDVRHAGRQLRQHPGFTAVAVLTIALGIGANTAVFSLINATLLYQPPYHEPSRLVDLWQNLPEAGMVRLGVSPAEYRDYRDRNRAFASTAAYETVALDATDGREAQRIKGVRIRPETILEPLAAEGAARARPVLLTFAAAVAFVLLIACSNVANLLLGRAAARRREIALRSALGASAGRLIRQLLTESLLLAGTGGVLGCLLAHLITSVATRVGPEQAPGLQSAAIDLRVLGFTVAVSLMTGLVCGLAPAIHSSRPNIGETLKSASRQGGDLGRSAQRARAALVIFETASAVVLLVCAALLIRSFVEVLQVSPGFNPEGVLVARTSFNRERYPDSPRRRLVERAIAERLRSLPGVTEVAITTHLPLADDRSIGFALEGSDPHDFYWANNTLVSGNYFSAMGIRLVRGRTFTDADSPEAPMVAVVNQTMAHTFWPGDDPIGKRILWAGRTLTIVGIAGDVRLQGLDGAVTPTVYNSVYQIESGATRNAVFVVRAATDVTRLGPDVRKIISSVDPGLPVFDVRRLDEIVAASLAARRFTMLLLASFAALALTLAVIGLYAVLSYLVAQRTSELGVRLALGASPRRIVCHVVSQGMRLAAAGALVGLLAGTLAATTVSSLLFGVRALDPTAFLVAPAVLLLVALAASYVPARRAATVDPLVALRSE
ncbi:MAG: FtsX-like permease family protein [Luteitalea sp.]|nr:FtsX-like permease family protein [Luteitalea sp.]